MLFKNNYKNFENKPILPKNVLPKPIYVNFWQFVIFVVL